MMEDLGRGGLWLTDTLWELGAIQFGDFTLGRTTVHSPVYVNPRLLVSHPTALWRAAHMMLHEVQAMQSMRHPQLGLYNLVAGVPWGGLHLATAFSLTAKVPMVYRYPSVGDEPAGLEGRYNLGDTVLVIDDIISTGGSIIESAEALREAGLRVQDAVVLIDRQVGGRERLRPHGLNLISILGLEVMLTYLMSSGRIDEECYRTCREYLKVQRARRDQG